MLDPLVGLCAVALAMLTLPAAPALDPGPNPACPADMRLVTGAHRDEVQHVCVDPVRSGKATHCFAYWEGITAEEGAESAISVCMDQFEAPNQRGARPLVMQSFEMAEAFCAARGKRMCTEQEWELACEGPERLPLAYGWRVDRTVCNSGKPWRPVDERKLVAGGEVARTEAERLWQGAASGAHAACVSPFGIYDLMGNVEEWVASRKGRRWPGALMGGFWAKPWTGCRGTNDAHEPKFAFYETGFRCCADRVDRRGSGSPRGALRPEPRTPAGTTSER